MSQFKRHLNRFYKNFSNPLFGNYRSLDVTSRIELIEELNIVNFDRSKNLATVLLVLDLLVMYTDLLNYRKGLWFNTPAYRLLFYFHVLFAIVMLLFLVISIYSKNRSLSKKNFLQKHYGVSFSYFILFFCTFASINDQLIHGQITLYILGMLVITIINYLTPSTNLLLYLSSFIIFTVGITFAQSDFNVLRGHYINSSILVVIAWLLSNMMFDLRIRDLLSKKTIEQQQLKLEETNNGLQLTNIELKKSLKALDESQNMVLTLIQALESKDTYTCGHSERVAEVVIKFARYLGLSELDQTALWRTGILHDLGKLGIPDAILNKNGPLTTEEWTIMQSHPANSELICSKLNFTRGILPIIRSHHERYDGTGYPDRLKEDDIPFLARIITIADSVDAIISKRPYRHARSLDEALNELEKGAGTQFDPYLVQAFLDFTKAQLSR